MNVAIIGAPVDLGADRRGVDMGPSAIRYAGLAARLREMGGEVRDFGNVPVAVPESTDSNPPSLKYLQPIVAMCEQLATTVSEAVRDGWFPLVLGGDHCVSLGSVTGISAQREVGLIWLDAHGDFNTARTSPSGNIHGMVLAALAGQGDDRLAQFGGRGQKINPRRMAMVGTRELDPGERTALRECGVHVFTMYDVDRIGLSRVVEMAIERAGDGVDGIHLSLDLDVVDPMQAPGVGTPVPGGLTYRETQLAMEMIAESNRMVGMDAVEVNPVLDSHNETARLAVEFILSALGKRII